MTLKDALARIASGDYAPGEIWVTTENVVIAFLVGNISILGDDDIITIVVDDKGHYHSVEKGD